MTKGNGNVLRDLALPDAESAKRLRFVLFVTV
jgi:hypothetical protein